jgi:tetratricopeptide (TPR) repeat protein
LGAVWDEADHLEAKLNELLGLEFLYERRAPDETLYVFKHALIQDVAYESLLQQRRAGLHAAAGRALERLYADRLDDRCDRLAYHYSRSELPAKAIEYLIRFAEKSARWYAHTESLQALEEALAHVERLPASERDRLLVEIALRQTPSLFLLGRLREVPDLLLGHRDRVRQLRDPALAGPYHFWLSHTSCILGDRDGAAADAERAISEATRCGDDTTLGRTHYVLGVEGLWSSRPRFGIESGRQAVACLERTKERYWLGLSHWVTGVNFTILGEFEPALDALASARAIGEAMRDPRLLSYASWNTGWIHALRGDSEAGIDACQQAVEEAPEPYSTAVALLMLGIARLEAREFGEAIPTLEGAFAEFERFQYRQIQIWAAASLGHAYLSSGETGKARAFALRGVQAATDFRHRYGVGLSQRVLGWVAEAEGTRNAAEAKLLEALEAFASIPAYFEQGRTHVALATVAHASGNLDLAATHLKEARATFVRLQVPRYVERADYLIRDFGALE